MLVLSFPEEVWFLDGERQQAAVASYAGRLGARARRAQEEIGQREKATMALCLSGGILAAILLF